MAVWRSECHVTLSQVSSSAALSHSNAFQFMSSTQKDISLKHSENEHIHNSHQLRKYQYNQQKTDPIYFHVTVKIRSISCLSNMASALLQCIIWRRYNAGIVLVWSNVFELAMSNNREKQHLRRPLLLHY